MAQGAVSVFVFEDQMTLRVGITHVLEQAGLAVKGVDGLPEVGSVTDQQVDPDACIVGLGTNHSATINAISAILAKREDAAIVVSGSNDPITIISRVYEAGARGYANAAESHTVLVDAVRSVVSSPRRYFPAGLAEELAELYTSGARQLDPRVLLSDTDLKIFTMLAGGRKHRDIAEVVGVTETSIGNRVGKLRARLGIARDEFTAVALRYNLIE